MWRVCNAWPSVAAHQDHLFCSIWWKTKQNLGITADMSLAKARVILQVRAIAGLKGRGKGGGAAEHTCMQPARVW